jgi:hypothetical protein
LASFALDLGGQPQEWLRNEPEDQLVNTVIDWVETVLCDPDAQVHRDPIEVPVPPTQTGQRLFVAQVPDTDIAVTFFEARPFRTIKVVWIERMTEALRDILGAR